MISRRWSRWVFAEYAADDGSIFGGPFLRVVDERETLAAEQDPECPMWENGTDGGSAQTLDRRPEPRSTPQPDRSLA